MSTVMWLLDNGMVLSLNKSMVIVQATRELKRTRGIPSNLTIRVQGRQLPCVESTKFLGAPPVGLHRPGRKVTRNYLQLNRALGDNKRLADTLTSHLMYVLPLVGGLWFPSKYLDCK